MKQKVVIIGHSYLSRLSLIRSVAQIGCEVSVVVMTIQLQGKRPSKKPIDCYSKYVSHYYYCERRNKESLITLLLEKCADPQQKVVLIPDGDDVVATIDNHQEILKKHFVFPHIINNPTSMEYWMDKTHQKRVAKEIGLNVAEAKIIDIEDGEYNIPMGIHYPCFSKPLATMHGGKGGMRRCNNPEELQDALNSFISTRNKTGRVLVEDYKEIDTEYALLGFSDGKEVIIPGILEFMVVSKQNKGIALQGKVMPVNGFESLLEKFRQLVKNIGFVGVFDIDFYKSGDIFYFCELNLRYGGSGYAITKMGVNLPAMMVRYFMGDLAIDEQKLISRESVYVNDRMCMADWQNGHITMDEYRHYLESADIRFVTDEEDPGPERAFNKEYKAQIIKKGIRKFIGR